MRSITLLIALLVAQMPVQADEAKHYNSTRSFYEEFAKEAGQLVWRVGKEDWKLAPSSTGEIPAGSGIVHFSLKVPPGDGERSAVLIEVYKLYGEGKGAPPTDVVLFRNSWRNPSVPSFGSNPKISEVDSAMFQQIHNAANASVASVNAQLGLKWHASLGEKSTLDVFKRYITTHCLLPRLAPGGDLASWMEGVNYAPQQSWLIISYIASNSYNGDYSTPPINIQFEESVRKLIVHIMMPDGGIDEIYSFKIGTKG